jgi:hypothetical protein
MKRRWKVAGAIRFNDEPDLFTKKIDDERPERLLPSKFGAVELSATQPSPKLSLRGGLGATQRAGTMG